MRYDGANRLAISVLIVRMAYTIDIMKTTNISHSINDLAIMSDIEKPEMLLTHHENS